MQIDLAYFFFFYFPSFWFNMEKCIASFEMLNINLLRLKTARVIDKTYDL